MRYVVIGNVNEHHKRDENEEKYGPESVSL